MGRYRKKPVEIEAVRVRDAITAAACSWGDLPEWLAAAYERGEVVFGCEAVYIQTLEGEMCGDFEDWIIRGVSGEIYPCKPEIFAQTYEPVDG